MMKNTYIRICLMAALLMVWGCSDKTKTVKTKLDRYEEDLTEYRPRYNEGPVVENPEAPELEVVMRPTHDVTENLDVALDSIASYHSSDAYVNGYKIQVYLGSSREEALNARDQLLQYLPDERPEVEYDQPNYKVKVGRYTERLQAQKVYMQLKKEFPAAIVIPARIPVE